MLLGLVVMCSCITYAVSVNLYNNERSDLYSKANIAAAAAVNADSAHDINDYLSLSLSGTQTRGILLDGTGEAVYDTNTAAKADGIAFTSPLISHALSGEQRDDVYTSHEGIKTLSVAVPVVENGAVTGAVFLSKDMTGTERLVGHVQNSLIVFSVIIMVMVTFLSLRMSRMVTTPLNEFILAVQEISKGNFDKKIPLKGNSEMDQLANAMNYMITQLEHLEAKRRKFVSDASHELKTPMATIKLICDSITASSDPDPAMVQEFLADLSEEVDRLTRIIEKLLLLTKLDSKETDISPELVDFGMMLHRIKNKLAPLAAGKNIIISTEMPTDTPPVMLDYDRIWESMYNVIDNAVKYSKIGATVKITAQVENGKLTVRIFDSGKGIPDEFKERIFERFYRLDDSRTRETGGTGLGLAIAREAVSLHGGKLYVEDNPEGGSCFVMTIPANAEPPKNQNGGEGK